MTETNHESVEGFMPLPALENTALERKLITGPRVFHGKTLAPYSFGAEGMIDEALTGIKSDALYSLTFLQVLSDLQEHLDRYGKDGWNGGTASALTDDTQINAATADVLQGVLNTTLYQARANTWRTKLGRKGVAEAIKLVNEIIKEAKDTGLMSAEDTNTPGK